MKHFTVAFRSIGVAVGLLCAAIASTAQTPGSHPMTDIYGHMGIGTIAPDKSAILDLSTTTAGFLMPRMTSAERNALVNPAVGLMIFNTGAKTIEFNIGTTFAPIWDRVLTTSSGGGLFWSLTGNGGTNPATNFIGTTDAQPLVVRTNNMERLRVATTGEVGIGTAAPTAGRLLEVAGTAGAANVRFGSASGAADGSVWAPGTNDGIITADGNGDLLKRTATAVVGSVAWLKTGNGGAFTDGVDNLIGTASNAPLNVIVNGNRAMRFEPNAASSPNIIGGFNGNSVGSVVGATISGGGESGSINQVTGNYGAVGGGRRNQASGVHSTVGGGYDNVASGVAPAIGGGESNRASGDYSSVGGGVFNIASGGTSTVGGGDHNAASGASSVVSGGYYNEGLGSYSAVVGGAYNKASGSNSAGGGGDINEASGAYSSVGGGVYNAASGGTSTVSGGDHNAASGAASAVGGGDHNTASEHYAMVGGGHDNVASRVASTIGGGENNRASGNYSAVGGGRSNQASGVHSTVSGGRDNVASGVAPAIGGGESNRASGDYSAVGGGVFNVASGGTSTVGGGDHNAASGASSVVSGGYYNEGLGSYSAVVGGAYNKASGSNSAVGGGDRNEASGSYSSVGGGVYNAASGGTSTVSGGDHNAASGAASAVGGGYYNTAAGDYSAIPGGRGLRLDGDRSFGFHANNSGGTLPMTITDANVAVFGNANLWLANNNNAPSELRFFEAYNASGNFPNTANYTAFKAQTQANDITYTLPASPAASNGDILTSTTGGVMQWSDADSIVTANAWSLLGNAGTTAGTNFVGTTDNVAFEIRVNNTGAATGGNQRVMRYEPNASSPNIIGGFNGNSVGAGVVGATISGGGADGAASQVTGDYGVVGGGFANTASGEFSTVGGGYTNTASGRGATVAGGAGNQASGDNSTVGGGTQNEAQGGNSTVGGGERNIASGFNSAVGGGTGNEAQGNNSTVGGGERNIASGSNSTVGGGDHNTASGASSTVSGGDHNAASGAASAVGGGYYNTAAGDYSAIPGGRGLRLNGARSFGFHANNSGGTLDMTITDANVAVFGNTDLWLANNDNAPSELRFFEAYNIAGDFPNGTANYTAFKAQTQANDITYTLPASNGTAGQVLTIAPAPTLTTATLTWTTPTTAPITTRTDVTTFVGPPSSVALAASGASFLRITTSPGAFTIIGLSGGVDGQILVIYNQSANNMTIADESGAEITAADRIHTMGGANLTTTGEGSVTLMYDGGQSRWIDISFRP
ncbi:MAG: hypothetical protein IPM61_08540 [Chlorobi bacterium]|nr:hypothetical protein [Chlorobiota bacterium]